MLKLETLTTEPPFLVPVRNIAEQRTPPANTAPEQSAYPHGPFPRWEAPDPIRDQVWHLLSSVLEVFDHRRTVHQLRNQLSPNVIAALETRTRTTFGQQRLHRLHSLHLTHPDAAVIEGCGLMWVSEPRRPERAAAIAIRMEQRKKQWICTALRST